MRLTFRKKNIAVLAMIVAASFGLGCEAARERDTANLEIDKAATAELDRLNKLLASNRPITRIDVDSLTRLREQYPGSPVVRRILQGALIKRGDWAAAEKIIEDTPANERTDADALNLAKIYLKQGKFSEAADLLKTIPPNAKDKLEATALLGQAHFYTGNLDEAAKSFESVQSDLIANKRADELTLLGTVYFRRGDHEKAIEILRKAVELSPDSIPANNALSRVFAASGDAANAEVFRGKLEQINAKIAAEEKRKSRLVPLFYQLEDAYTARDFEKVIAIAQQIKPEADDATKPALYQYLAAAYRELGRESEAKEALAEAGKFTQK